MHPSALRRIRGQTTMLTGRPPSVRDHGPWSQVQSPILQNSYKSDQVFGFRGRNSGGGRTLGPGVVRQATDAYPLAAASLPPTDPSPRRPSSRKGNADLLRLRNSFPGILGQNNNNNNETDRITNKLSLPPLPLKPSKQLTQRLTINQEPLQLLNGNNNSERNYHCKPCGQPSQLQLSQYINLYYPNPNHIPKLISNSDLKQTGEEEAFLKKNKKRSKQLKRRILGSSEANLLPNKPVLSSNNSSKLLSNYNDKMGKTSVISPTKSPKEILYDIATGTWSDKHIVPDQELGDNVNAAKSLSSRPCSNAICVKEVERQKRRKQIFNFKLSQDSFQVNDEENELLFDEGDLPSYHSLTDFWKHRECQWQPGIFKNGYPQNEVDFIEAWRECRKNPEAYGIKPKPKEEIPDKDTLRMEKHSKIKDSLSRRNGSIPLINIKTDLISTVTREDNHINFMQEREQALRVETEYNTMRKRFEELRELYPHIAPIKDSEHKKISMQRLKIRWKQAEDWHKLIMASSINFDCSNNNNVRCDSRITKNSLILPEITANVPRYATNTKSFIGKMQKQQ